MAHRNWDQLVESIVEELRGEGVSGEVSMLAFALAHARSGRPVFPLQGKIPFAGTHGVKDAMLDEVRIKEMWARHPGAHIGMATSSERFALDVDVKKGKFGEESLHDLEQKHGPLPRTVESKTASGGRHLFFRNSTGVSIHNSQSKVGQDLDIRGEGGYVVAPGSVIDGVRYEWEVSGHLDEVEVAEAPQWLIDKAVGVAHKERVQLPEGEIPQGKQDETLFRLACSLKAQGFTEGMVRGALREALGKCPQDPADPFTDDDIERWIRSAFSYKDNATRKPGEFYNDVWNANMLVKQHGHNIRNCDQLGGWHIWNGKVWDRDEVHSITKLARETVQSFSALAAGMAEGSKEQKLFLQHIRASGNESKLASMIKLARSNKDVSVLTHEFDTSPYLLNCQNGIVDLKNGRFLMHSPDLLLTKICNTVYDQNAQCPRWEEFLQTVFMGNRELIDFIQKVTGYALTADVSFQMFFILHGSGANGKSTYVETVYRMLGSYAAITPTSTLTAKRGGEIPNDVARLKGARFVISSELERSKVLDEALVKRFTSEEPIPARFLHKEFFEFSPTAKIFLSTNYKPTIKGTDDGIWRRLKLIPFEHKFEGTKKIEKFAEKFLFPELPGILRWAVDGYRRLMSEGLKEPEIVRYATDEYKSSEDSIGGYIDEFCVVEPYCKVLVLDLYEHFKDNSEHFMRKKDFNDYLERRGFIREKGSAGVFKGRWTWYGLGLRAEAREEQERESRP